MDTLLGVSISTWIEMQVEAERRGYSVEEFVTLLQSDPSIAIPLDVFIRNWELEKEVSFDEWNW